MPFLAQVSVFIIPLTCALGGYNYRFSTMDRAKSACSATYR